MKFSLENKIIIHSLVNVESELGRFASLYEGRCSALPSATADDTLTCHGDLLPTSEATLKSFLFMRPPFLDLMLATVLYLQSLSSSSLQRSEFNKHMPSIFYTALLLRGLECGFKDSIMLPRVPLHFVRLGGVRLLITCYF